MKVILQKKFGDEFWPIDEFETDVDADQEIKDLEREDVFEDGMAGEYRKLYDCGIESCVLHDYKFQRCSPLDQTWKG